MVRFRYRRLSRAAWILTGLLGLAWIGVEDRGLTAVITLAWMIALSSLLTVRARRGSPGAGGMRSWVLQGAAAGVLVAPIAAVLILLKVGLHAHPLPDFSSNQVASLLARMPVWAAAGGILGAGAALIERAAEA